MPPSYKTHKGPWTALPVPIELNDKKLLNSICIEIPSNGILMCSFTVNTPIKVNLHLGPP